MAKPQKTPVSAAPAATNEPTYEEIARRAYERFLARGGQHGAEVDDWLAAEQELKQTLRFKR